jgi:hypothetical protein
LYDAFDFYISLFYFAFYEMNIVKLRSALMSLLVGSIARRLVVESIIPLITQIMSADKEVQGVCSDYVAH